MGRLISDSKEVHCLLQALNWKDVHCTRALIAGFVTMPERILQEEIFFPGVPSLHVHPDPYHIETSPRNIQSPRARLWVLQGEIPTGSAKGSHWAPLRKLWLLCHLSTPSSMWTFMNSSSKRRFYPHRPGKKKSVFFSSSVGTMGTFKNADL